MTAQGDSDKERGQNIGYCNKLHTLLPNRNLPANRICIDLTFILIFIHLEGNERHLRLNDENING